MKTKKDWRKGDHFRIRSAVRALSPAGVVTKVVRRCATPYVVGNLKRRKGTFWFLFHEIEVIS